MSRGVLAAIGVHLAVGYTDPWHMAPAFAALGVYFLAASLPRGWLCAPDSVSRVAWRAQLRSNSYFGQ